MPAIREQLKVHFAGRLDQVHFKLYAAVDQGPGRHLNDLIALTPTASELELAARWTFTHDDSEGYRTLLKEMLEYIGHGDVAARL